MRMTSVPQKGAGDESAGCVVWKYSCGPVGRSAFIEIPDRGIAEEKTATEPGCRAAKPCGGSVTDRLLEKGGGAADYHWQSPDINVWAAGRRRTW
jgi:hypothetical protein